MRLRVAGPAAKPRKPTPDEEWSSDDDGGGARKAAAAGPPPRAGPGGQPLQSFSFRCVL
jgi:hypothetical protein